MKFGFITSKNGEFVTSSFPVLNGIDEATEENAEMTYFPLHPHIAVLYGNSMHRKAWNRVTPMAVEVIDFLNKKYFKLHNEQIRFIYAKERKY